MFKSLMKLGLAAALLLPTIESRMAHAADEPVKVTVAWSYYAYWYQWPYAKSAGIVEKWEKLKGVKIDIVEANSYEASMDRFRSGDIDAVTVTNGDAWGIALARPAVFLIAGDYSNDNDLVLSNEFESLPAALDAKAKFRYADNSVSDTLLFACARTLGTDIRRIRSVNQAESDLVIPFENGDDSTVVAWKPFADQITNTGAKRLCGSADFPGLIVDGLLVSDDMPQAAREALVGIWYDTVQSMGPPEALNDDVLKEVAAIPGDTLESYKSQLDTTHRLDDPAEAIAFLESDVFRDMMLLNRQWLLTTGLDEGEVDGIGVKLPNGDVLGDQSNVRLVFDTGVMQQAADGDLK